MKTLPSALRDPALEAYLRDILCRLGGSHCPDIRFYVVRNALFNAAMMPTGGMLIHTGFLLQCLSESQVAAVLVHEIGHYLRRHSIARYRWERLASTVGVFLGLGTQVYWGLDSSDFLQTLIIGSSRAYSRDNEREADVVGLRLLADAGYDPFAAAQTWDMMITQQELAGEDPRWLSFLATHPPAQDRAEYLRERAPGGTAPLPHRRPTVIWMSCGRCGPCFWRTT